jgi:hypothetical protein
MWKVPKLRWPGVPLYQCTSVYQLYQFGERGVISPDPYKPRRRPHRQVNDGVRPRRTVAARLSLRTHAAWRKIDAAHFRYLAGLECSLDDLVTEQPEDAPSRKDRSGVAVPVHTRRFTIVI